MLIFLIGLINISLILNVTGKAKDGLLSHTSLLSIFQSQNHFIERLHILSSNRSSYNTAPVSLFQYRNLLSLHFLLVADLNRVHHVAIPNTLIFPHLGICHHSLLQICLLCQTLMCICLAFLMGFSMEICPN